MWLPLVDWLPQNLNKMPVIGPSYDLQLNYSIGGNFNTHLPTFSMDGRFPFYYALGSFLMQNFPHFQPTLAGPISDQAGPSGILSNWPNSPASVVSDSDSLNSSKSSEGLQETQKKQYAKWQLPSLLKPTAKVKKLNLKWKLNHLLSKHAVPFKGKSGHQNCINCRKTCF